MLMKLRQADGVVHVHGCRTARVMWLCAFVRLWPHNGAGVLSVHFAFSLFLVKMVPDR